MLDPHVDLCILADGADHYFCIAFAMLGPHTCHFLEVGLKTEHGFLYTTMLLVGKTDGNIFQRPRTRCRLEHDKLFGGHAP